MRISRKEFVLGLVLIGIPGFAWIGSELRWARINSPHGRFTCASQYLATGRLPSRVAKITSNGSRFWIAYGPMDHWLAVPSGSAAYVFDESGRMVAWSRDSGDDVAFQRSWPMSREEDASIEDLKRIGVP